MIVTRTLPLKYDLSTVRYIILDNGATIKYENGAERVFVIEGTAAQLTAIKAAILALQTYTDLDT